MAANAAPGALETVRRFANSIDIETGEEELSSPAALAEWLRDHALCERAPRLKREDLERGLELRDALRAVLLANAGGVELSPSSMTTLNRQLSAAPLALQFTASGKAHLEPAGQGLEAAFARLAAIVNEAMADGTWWRLKICIADDCSWAFYDRSRNHSAHWCDMANCGNRAKVKAFRQRRTEAG